MLYLKLYLLAVYHLQLACSSSLLEEEWLSWKARHGANYKDWGEESKRRQIWEDNYHTITKHNEGNYTFQMGLNQFADLVR